MIYDIHIKPNKNLTSKQIIDENLFMAKNKSELIDKIRNVEQKFPGIIESINARTDEGTYIDVTDKIKNIIREDTLGKPVSPKMSLRNVLQSLFDTDGYEATFFIKFNDSDDKIYKVKMNGQIYFTDKRFESSKYILNEIAQTLLADGQFTINSYYTSVKRDKEVEELIKQLQTKSIKDAESI